MSGFSISDTKTCNHCGGNIVGILRPFCLQCSRPKNHHCDECQYDNTRENNGHPSWDGDHDHNPTAA